MNMFSILLALSVIICLHGIAYSVTGETGLIWTEKRLDNSVRVMGIPGHPLEWIDHGVPNHIPYGTPANLTVRRKSHRTAIGFQYTARTLFFSDVGFREIFRMRLSNATDYEEKVTYVNVEPVFSGISTKVRGVAVDWQSGNVYWTDMLYNWITVASGDEFEIYRHIVTTGLDKPYGIAVYPQKGYLFWTDQGPVPKVERSYLDGTGRETLVVKDVVRPTGVAIDYPEDHVYWLEDEMDWVVRMDLDGGNRLNMVVKDPDNSNFQYLTGITVYGNFIMISDQFMLNIKLYDKNMSYSRGSIDLRLGVPYDVMMYDSNLQEDFQSDCDTMNCDDMCMNMGNGTGRCMCSQGFVERDGGSICERSEVLTKPQFIYSLSSQICASHVRKVNLDSQLHGPTEGLQCFRGDLSQTEALALDVYGDLLFFSDTEDGTIRRARLADDAVVEVHALQAGAVRGLAVDWITSKLYWADEARGHIMVSELDGRLPREIVTNVDNPRGLVVDPVHGYMYWSTSDAIYRANMDGSDSRVIVATVGENPDGMTINYLDNRLYWVDNSLHSILYVNLDGSNRTTVLSDPDKTFRDVSVFQDYIAWTDGTSKIYFGEIQNNAVTNIRAVEHVNEELSHDIIVYDESAQPLVESACDIDNGGCNQLCLLIPAGRRCACTFGFQLDKDNKTCKSDIKSDNFLLFLDPYHKGIYQVDLISPAPAPVQGVELHETTLPTVLAYDSQELMLYWYDADSKVIKKKLLTAPRQTEQIITTLEDDTEAGAMVVNVEDRLLLYTDTKSRAIIAVHLPNIMSVDVIEAGPVITSALAWEKRSRFLFWVAPSETSGLTLYKGRLGSLPNKIVVTDQKQLATVNGIAIDDRAGRVYWWDDTAIYSCELSGRDAGIEHLGRAESPFVSLAAYDSVLYISERNKQTVYRYNLVTETIDEFTSPLFSNVRSLQIYVDGQPYTTRRVPTIPSKTKPSLKPTRPIVTATPTPQTTLAAGNNTSSGQVLSPGGSNVMVLAIACAAAGVVLLIIIVVVVVVVRRRKNKRPRKHIEQELKAHDNPTYMRADEVPPRQPPPPAVPQSRPAAATGFDDYPTKDGAPFSHSPDVTPSAERDLPAILPMRLGQTSSGEVVKDTDTLVHHMADQAEVTLNMEGGENMVVSYSPETANSGDTEQ